MLSNNIVRKIPNGSERWPTHAVRVIIQDVYTYHTSDFSDAASLCFPPGTNSGAIHQAVPVIFTPLFAYIHNYGSGIIYMAVTMADILYTMHVLYTRGNFAM